MNPFKANRNQARPLSSVLLLCLLTSPLGGAITTIIDVDVDTRVLELFPDDPQGTFSFLSVHFISTGQDQHTLLLFDVSALAPADVGSATLVLDALVDFGTNTSNLSMDVFRVTQSWMETETTWNLASTSTSWSNPGGDFVGVSSVQATNPFASSTANPSSNGEDVSWDVTSLVLGWVDETFDNKGLAIASSIGNQLHFASREAAVSNPATFEGPRLVITPVPEPSAIGWALSGSLGVFVLASRHRRSCHRDNDI